MDGNKATTDSTDDPAVTQRRLASEMAEVEGAIALVASGTASRVTLSGLRFGEPVMASFELVAARAGVLLEPIPWPEDAGCDLIIRRNDA
jgi:hypothetical protein